MSTISEGNETEVVALKTEVNTMSSGEGETVSQSYRVRSVWFTYARG